MPGKVKLRFELELKAPVEQVYRMFTNRIGFEEWLCDTASISPTPGGRVFLSWNTGYASAGMYRELKSNKHLEFTWRGSHDPAETRVTIRLVKKGASTLLTLIHSDIWQGKKWEKTEQEIREGWVTGLRNLASVLECGPDLRITTRPMLGIYLGEPLSPDLAKTIGVPVSEGVRLEGVIPGLGAQQCGLQKDDVLVELEGTPLRTVDDIAPVMRGRKAGDTLQVTYFRGQAKQTAAMLLAPRKTFDLPASAQSFADFLRQQYAATDQELFGFLATITDEDAGIKPTNDEWNIKQVLAHLILCERDLQTIIHAAILSEPAGFVDNTPARIQALLTAYPTLAELMAEFRHAEKETLAFVEALPATFTARKSSFWVLANNIYNFNDHTREHLEQMRGIITKK